MISAALWTHNRLTCRALDSGKLPGMGNPRFNLFCLIFLLFCSELQAQPVGSLDLATVSPGDGVYRRVLGSVGIGAAGVPVAGAFDIDGDGHVDYALAAFQAGVTFNRSQAGQVFLIFGDSQISGVHDTATNPSHILRIIGDQVQENAGSEVWMGDVTGDGLGDLIICRQNYSPGGTRIGAGALTLLPGGQALRTLATNNTTLDLRNPPVNLPIINIHGAQTASRLCIWARVGDVTGDGIHDLVVGADQESDQGNAHSGAVYVIRGGVHLATSKTIDLASFGSTQVGNIARIRTPINSAHFHLGATVQVADLDGNGKAEVMAAAALNRSGAGLGPVGGSVHPTGGYQPNGNPTGKLYIAWDDNFGGTWIPAPDFRIGLGPGSDTEIIGGARNNAFGEEILGGLDYDADGEADLFVGDLTANGWGAMNVRSSAGTAHVIYDIASLKNQTIAVDTPPPGFSMATFVGPVSGAIAGDTAMHGDFNGDGIADLAFSSPKDRPLGRVSAGTLHIVLGQNTPFPAISDLNPANYPSSGVNIFEIYGAEGNGFGGEGDTLCYSGADSDVNGDGIIDLIINEMEGDGTSPLAMDVGNLLILNSAEIFEVGHIFEDGFEDSD